MKQPILILVSTDDWWVYGLFEQSRLGLVEAGDEVGMIVRFYPGRVFFLFRSLDTNFVLHQSRDASQADKQMRAAEWISHLWKTGKGRLSLQVLTEFYAVVTGELKPGMEVANARKDVEDLFA